MLTPATSHSSRLQAERAIALNYFTATLEQMPTEIQKHPVLQTAIETMEHYISGEGTDGERRHMFFLRQMNSTGRPEPLILPVALT
jgi:hypothetical protein